MHPVPSFVGEWTGIDRMRCEFGVAIEDQNGVIAVRLIHPRRVDGHTEFTASIEVVVNSATEIVARFEPDGPRLCFRVESSDELLILPEVLMDQNTVSDAHALRLVRVGK